MLSLKKLKKVHMIGIKGTGMSALALLLAKLGIQVTGSDTADSFLLLPQSYFTKAGIKIFPIFEKKNLLDVTSKALAKEVAIIASSSHLSKNKEILEAKKRDLPIMTYEDTVGLLSREFPSIAVCGSHGKTTTTNLLAHVMQKAHVPVLPLAGPTSEQILDNFTQGADELLRKASRSATGTREQVAPPAGGDNRFSKSPSAPTFIFEADEYKNKLKSYSPFGVILTNVELDHPDYFKTQASYEKVYADFIKRIPENGFLVYCADDATAMHVASKAKCKTIGYGFSEHSDYRIRAVTDSDTATPFAIHHNDALVGVYRTPLLGTHNILNSTAVVLATLELGIEDGKNLPAGRQVQNGLMSFRGSPRRMEVVSKDPLIIDDYGHHPTEVKATLQALRSAYPKKTIWTVFHPHTFTRTKKFLKEFGDSFADSDHTIVLEIWGSAREKAGEISSQDVVDLINKKVYPNRKGRAYYAATFEEAANILKGKLNDKTLLLTIGAGDVWKLHKLIK